MHSQHCIFNCEAVREKWYEYIVLWVDKENIKAKNVELYVLPKKITSYVSKRGFKRIMCSHSTCELIKLPGVPKCCISNVKMLNRNGHYIVSSILSLFSHVTSYQNFKFHVKLITF
jgi:hypothetical protein